ncbi:hypothetical protein SAMN05421543_10974 [Alicyclobacillus macrosporangiidus]|jgi:hypothetical protein|uniref:Uncharacterized protein n=1 Tax=Alicyclobacillus macrosporangiidus TaxID=392015 RepID=A0A1I7JBI5_9BACL|nr:hypothetical protein SAMN05421543_10974 [Alicyclobacillus macrosporangiidus]
MVYTPPWVDGDLDLIWDLRAPQPWAAGQLQVQPGWTRAQPLWWSGAYPVLGPWHAFAGPDPAWWDAWSLQPYHGYWA